MIILLIGTAVLIGLILAISAIVPQDGYGHRPVPRSHIDPYSNPNRFI